MDTCKASNLFSLSYTNHFFMVKTLQLRLGINVLVKIISFPPREHRTAQVDFLLVNSSKLSLINV